MTNMFTLRHHVLIAVALVPLLGGAVAHANDSPNGNPAAAQQAAAIASHRAEINKDEQDTVIHNPTGTITLVELSDYNCPNCKAMIPRVLRLSKNNPDVKVVIKEFPFIDDSSLLAARWALAAGEQGKYKEFHEAAMSQKGVISEGSLTALAIKIGLNAQTLKAAAASDKITLTLKDTQALAAALGIDYGPAFIIGDRVMIGNTSIEALVAAVVAARQKNN